MSRPLEILLVEDNPADVRLMMAALEQGKVAHQLTVVHDGREALAVLGLATQPATHRPDVIFLDLAVPGVDGFTVLATIKGNAALRSIPVVILSVSADDRDVLRAYELQANSFVTKPRDPAPLVSVLKSIESFWLLPHRR